MDHTNEAQTPNIDDRSGKARGRTGTKGFLAPEVALGMVYSVRADLWSTGVTLFLCLAGRMPIADDMVVPRPNVRRSIQLCMHKRACKRCNTCFTSDFEKVSRGG